MTRKMCNGNDLLNGSKSWFFLRTRGLMDEPTEPTSSIEVR